MPDPYNNPDSQPEATLQAMIQRLEERGRHPSFLAMIEAYVDLVPKDRALCALDLGCGTGVVSRHLLKALHQDSVIHGADISAELIKEASRLCPDPRVSWDRLAPGDLPYETASFDVIVMHTLLSHVPEPMPLLREAKRLLKPQGQLIIFDADHAGTTYAQADYETTRRIDHLLISAIATHPAICRQMPRLLHQAGLVLVHHDVDVISECGKGDYWLSSVQGFARMMPSIHALTPEEADAWVKFMLDSHENGSFFAAGAFYTFHAKSENEDALARSNVERPNSLMP
jgi:SAM-dependent methyltransferase